MVPLRVFLAVQDQRQCDVAASLGVTPVTLWRRVQGISPMREEDYAQVAACLGVNRGWLDLSADDARGLLTAVLRLSPGEVRARVGLETSSSSSTLCLRPVSCEGSCHDLPA